MRHTGTQHSAIDLIGAVEKYLLTENTRVPIALQWMFPTPLAILIWLAPESPWWLTRKGRYEDAAKAVGRLGDKTKIQANNESVAMMRRTIDLEKDLSNPSLLELWKGTDRYRTLIVCGVYAAQNLTGNLIANREMLPIPICLV
jgi:SP family general alpha glucoside:H+ symporter-like MFS transporter